MILLSSMLARTLRDIARNQIFTIRLSRSYVDASMERRRLIELDLKGLPIFAIESVLESAPTAAVARKDCF